MDQFLERCNLPKLTKEEINNVNRLISIRKAEEPEIKLPTSAGSWKK